MLSKRKCPICNNNQKNKILWETMEILPEEITLPREITVVACNVCGFCYLDTPATMKDYDDYYENNNIYGTRSSIKNNWMGQALRLTNNLFKNSDMILDMGTGSGEWLNELKLNGYLNLYGMDVAEANVNMLCNMGIKGDIASVYTPVKNEYKTFFDVVFLTGVLEHILFPQKAINNMSQYLKKDGKMVIMVPNIELIGDGIDPSHHFHHEHINYFSIVTLDRLMHDEGFSRVHYENMIETGDSAKSVIAVYEKSTGEGYEDIVDTTSALVIERYLQDYRNRHVIVEQKLNDIRNETIILWGMGTRMMQMLATTELQSMNIAGCIDGNLAKRNTKVIINNRKYVINNPDDINEKIDDTTIIVICCNSKQYEAEINATITQKGLKNRLLYL